MQHAHGGFQLCGQLCARAVGISYLELQLLFSCSVVSNSLQPHGLQHTRPPCPSPSPRACSNSCPLNRLYHPTISSSAAPFCSCPQSFPASGLFHHIRWPEYWSFSWAHWPVFLKGWPETVCQKCRFWGLLGTYQPTYLRAEPAVCILNRYLPCLSTYGSIETPWKILQRLF